MNKPYFIKHIKVENGIQKQVKNTDGIPIDFQYEIKTWLCSRNVNIDDECYHQKYPEIRKWTIKEGDAEDCVDWHGENVDVADLYKIIGWVSPYTNWVKDGDEFDETDLRWSINNQYGDQEDVIDWNSLTYPSEYDRILIKGPCGHFH